MTPRERLLRAIKGLPVDRLPTEIGFTPMAAEQAAGWLGVPVQALPSVLGNHRLSIQAKEASRVEGTTTFDFWGIGWDNTLNDGFQVNVSPLADLDALATFRFPDPDDPALYAGIEEQIARDEGRRAVMACAGFCLWERYYLLRGFENAMEDLAAEPALVEDLLDRILEVQMAIARNLISLGAEIGHTGDDFGSQRGLLFSPATWRRLIKPRYRKLWGVYIAAGLPVTHHSCGDVREILDDMIEIGLDMLNPVQTHAMPPQDLAERFGDRLGFWGGICTQKVLPFGTPDEVREHTSHLRATLGRRGRYLIGPSHALMSDVPRENFFAMLEAMGVEPSPM